MREFNKIFFFILTLIIALLAVFQTIDYQPLLSQGDHGRDLYAAYASLHGEIPYKDYWWVYGPLMPYFYGASFKLLGVNILSMLAARGLLLIITAIFFYLALNSVIVPTFAFIGTIWFLFANPQFFHTYNHAGATCAAIIIIYLIFKYLYCRKPKYLFISLFVTLILTLIKLNTGFFTLLGLLISVFLINKFKPSEPKIKNQKIIFYLCGIFLLPLLTFIVYYFFLRGLPIYEIRQCMPFLGGDQPHTSSVLESITKLYDQIFGGVTTNFINFSLFALIIFSFAQIIFQLLNKSVDKEIKTTTLLVLAILIIFYFLNLNEFFVGDLTYRYFWALPFGFMLIFVILGTALKDFPKIVQTIFFYSIILILFLNLTSSINLINKNKNTLHYLNLLRGKIFVGNNPQWVQTVSETVKYIQNNVKNNEKFFALPYDPIYYFLCDQLSPTRQLIFFDHINIKPEQEEKIINELKNNNVNWIILSNRFSSLEKGLGILGKTYCPLLYNYINENFKFTEKFGDLKNTPGWAWNYGVLILKRIRTE